MKEKLQAPLLLPTLSFIVGCVVARALQISIWTPLAIFLVSGVLYFFRRWSSLLLIMAVAVGGVRGSLYDNKDDDIQVDSTWVEETAFTRASDNARQRLQSLELSARAENLVLAMVLGDRSEITSRQRQEYGRSGASHILALSGLHLSVVFILLNLLLLPLVMLPRGHIVRNILVVVLIWMYVIMVGSSPSVVRGGVMFSVVQMGFAWGRPYSGLNALLFTLLCVAVVSPDMLYSVGFQLSVISVVAIFLWALPLYYNFFKGGGLFISALCIGGACSVATMPIVSNVFGYTPLLGIAFSPLFILTAFVIITCGVWWIFLPISLFAPIVRFIIEVAAMLQERAVELIAGVNWGVISWRATDFQMWLIYLIYILITILIWGEKGEAE